MIVVDRHADLHEVAKGGRPTNIIPTSDSFSTHVNNVNSTLSNSIEEAPEDALPDHYWVATIDVEKRTQFVLTPAVRDALRQHGSLDLVSTPRDRVSFRSSESSSETPVG